MRRILRSLWRILRILPLAFAGIGPRPPPPEPQGPAPTEQHEIDGDRG